MTSNVSSITLRHGLWHGGGYCRDNFGGETYVPQSRANDWDNETRIVTISDGECSRAILEWGIDRARLLIEQYGSEFSGDEMDIVFMTCVSDSYAGDIMFMSSTRTPDLGKQLATWVNSELYTKNDTKADKIELTSPIDKKRHVTLITKLHCVPTGASTL